MKVMKFGGTSVGQPDRMKNVAQLATSSNEPAIVVLSALSGTTNALVEIGSELANGHRENAKKLIEALEEKYYSFIKSLIEKPDALKKAHELVAEHFEFLNIILKISFSEALFKDIVAQGELLSTRLFSIYLEEKEIEHVLRSEEHTSELQSRENLVCRLL